MMSSDRLEKVMSIPPPGTYTVTKLLVTKMGRRPQTNFRKIHKAALKHGLENTGILDYKDGDEQGSLGGVVLFPDGDRVLVAQLLPDKNAPTLRISLYEESRQLMMDVEEL